MRRTYLALSIGLVALALHDGAASAQTYPNKPIRIIVPFAAGGTVDQLARIVGAKLSEAVGQSVVIENRAGVGGNAGAEAVAKAAPDGYTILQNTNGQAIAPALYRSLPFDTAKDFIPVTQLVASQLMLVASPKLEAKTTGELIALAKAKPGSLNYGMTGIGNPLHLTMEMLKTATGIELQAIPYRGDAPLNTALIAGEVHLAVVPVATAKPNVEAGLIRALAVAGAKRIRTLPEVPTIAESGVPGFESSSWQGLFVPANTPKDVVLTIQREVAKILNTREVRERLEATGNEVIGSTPEEFDAKFKADLAKFAKVVKDARIAAQD
jgi:tripartite-type tricarboxylate transporter receptor subunit TctC